MELTHKRSSKNKIQTHELSNGFRIVHEIPSSSLQITSIYAYCKFGSAYEIDQHRGAAHMIEHMCFKGTKKIPKARNIFLNYDRIGARFNAYTEKQLTCYTVKCEDEYFENSLHIVSDMMLNSVFKNSEYVKEHQVVIEENSSSSDDLSDIISNIMEKNIYNGSSYDEPIDDISYHKKDMLKHDEIVKLYKSYYSPNNMVLSVVSNIPFEQVLKAVRSSYFSKKTPKLALPSLRLAYAPQTHIKYDFYDKSGNNTTHLMIGFRTCSQISTDKYLLDFLKNILNGSLSSRLFIILREDNGLTYRSSGYTTYYDNLGDFSIYAETDYKKLMYNGKSKPGVLPIIIRILNDLIKNGVTETEVTETKSNLKGKLMLNLEDNDTQSSYNGEQVLLYDNIDHIVPYREFYNEFYKNITKEQINNVIKKYFMRENMTVCIAGSHIPSLNVIKRECERM
jgi:predicted Zn-dependent peptidase